MLFFPLKVDGQPPRSPWTNWLFLLCLFMLYTTLISGNLPDAVIKSLLLYDWSPSGLFGYMFLETELIPALTSMFTLWVFGNAVCARIGNLTYFLCILLCSLTAGVAHLLLDGQPCSGAEGAVSGMMGLFLFLYPRNRVACWWWFFRKTGTIKINGYWLIVVWCILDLALSLLSGKTLGYAPRLAAFACGTLCSSTLIFQKRILMGPQDLPHLLHLLFPQWFKPLLKRRAASKTTIKVVEPEYYIYHQDKQSGPYAVSAIRGMVTQQQVQLEDFFYDPIKEEWREIRNLMVPRPS